MSSNNFEIALSKRNSELTPWLMSNPYVDVEDRDGRKSKVLYPLSNNTLERTYDTPINPSVPPASNILIGGSNAVWTDYNIPIFDAILVDFYIILNLTESGGVNSVSPTISNLMVNYLTIIGDNSKELQRLYGHTIWSDLGCYSNETIASLASVINMTTNFAPFQVISAGGSLRLIIKPVGNCLSYWKLYTQKMNTYITIRVYWNGSCVESGTGTLSLSSTQLVATYIDLPDIFKGQIRDFYSKYTIDLPVFTTIQAPYPATYNASTTSNIVLSSFQGEMAYIQALFLPSTLTGSNNRNVTYPGDNAIVTFLNSNNISILGSNGQTADILRKYETATLFNGNFYSCVGAIPIMFDIAPSFMILYGQESGYYYGDTKAQFNIQLPATWTSGNYTLILYLRTRQHVHFNTNGTFTVELP